MHDLSGGRVPDSVDMHLASLDSAAVNIISGGGLCTLRARLYLRLSVFLAAFDSKRVALARAAP